MDKKSARQQQLKSSVMDVLTDADIDFSVACLKLWNDVAATIDVSRTRKPQTWAAAVYYTIMVVCGSHVSRSEVAAIFGVSYHSVSTKHHQILSALNVKYLDGRYLTQGELDELRMDMDFMEGIPIAEEANQRTQGLSQEGNAWDDLGGDGPDVLAAVGWIDAEQNPDRAQVWFRKALDLDPTHVSALYGLAVLTDGDGHKAEAEQLYRLALKIEASKLGSVLPDDYHWWLDPETRTYMEIRKALGWFLHNTDRYAEAAREFKALLRLNPDDDQGMRFLTAPEYLLAGDVTTALKEYAEYDKVYVGDMRDAHFTWCRGFALYAAGRYEEAAASLRSAIFENVYVAPLLLGAPRPHADQWYESELRTPDYAVEYIILYGGLWEGATGACSMLRHLWNDPEVMADMGDFVRHGQELLSIVGKARRGNAEAEVRCNTLLAKRREIETRELSSDSVRRILAEL